MVWKMGKECRNIPQKVEECKHCFISKIARNYC